MHRICIALSLTCLFFSSARAADLEWTGSGLNPFWSLTDNWSPIQAPLTGDNLSFGDAGTTNVGNTATSVMDLPSPFTVNDLTFTNASGRLHQLDLDGSALNVSNRLLVGYNNHGQTSEVSIVAGALSLGSASNRAADVLIGYVNAAGASPNVGVLNLDLFSFEAYVDGLLIGRRFAANSAIETAGTLDLSSSDSAFIDANRIFLGTGTDNGNRLITGELFLPTNGVSRVTTPDMLLGNSSPAGNQGTTSVVGLGNATTLEVGNLRVGGFKSNGRMAFPVGTTGHTLTLRGLNGAGDANVQLGYNTTGTGTSAQGTLDVRGGTLTGNINQLIMGYHGSGAGNGRGTFIMDGGSLTAAQIDMALTDQGGASANPLSTTAWIQQLGGLINVTNAVTDGSGTSEVRVESGNMLVANGFAADRLIVGLNGGSGQLRAGGAVRIGTGNQVHEIGLRSSGNVNTSGFADFRTASSVLITGNELRMGRVASGNNTFAQGELYLSETGTNTIDVGTFSVGDSNASANTGGLNTVRFGGGTNIVQSNFIHVGRRKSRTNFEILPGGHLDIQGRSGPLNNFRIGLNDINTATNTEGNFDSSPGTLTAALDDVIIGQHNQGSGSGKGTFRMGAGTVTANHLSLGNTSVTGNSGNPQNTTGTLIIEQGGTFDSASEIIEGGGQSRIEVLEGRLSGRRDFRIDTVVLGGSTNAPGVLELNDSQAGNTWKIPTLDMATNSVLRLNYGATYPVVGTDNATFANGAILEAGVAIATNSVSTNATDASTWIGGTGTWDNDPANWDNGLPSGSAITNGTAFTAIVATNTLVDNGLVSGTPGWDINVTANTVELLRSGPTLTGGQIPAIIGLQGSQATRTGGLVIGNQVGSGADASQLTINLSRLTVDGGIASDGGFTSVRNESGTLEITNGGLFAHDFRSGYLVGTSRVTVVGGPIELGNPAAPAIIDIARREGNPGANRNTFSEVNFSGATRTEITASSLRIGTADASNGPQFEGVLYLADATTNQITAARIVVGDSPVEGNSALPGGRENGLILGGEGAINTINTDRMSIGYRKAIGFLQPGPNGSTLNLNSINGNGVDLDVGFNEVNGTGTISDGIFNVDNAVFNADLRLLRVGRHNNGPGAGQGRFVMGDGAVTVRTNVELARVSVGGTSTNPGDTTGQLTLNGGSLDVSGNILDRGGISTLNVDGGAISATAIRNLDQLTFTDGRIRAQELTGTLNLAMTGGRLAVDLINTDLLAEGGVIAPGDSVGSTTITANHSLSNAAWEIEIDVTTNDVINVASNLVLDAGSTLSITSINASASSVIVIASYGSLSGTFAVTNGLPAGATVDYNYQGNQQIALLQTPGRTFSAGVRFVGDDASISWPSEAGETYTIQRSPSLDPPNWTDIATGIVPNPPTNTYNDQTPEGDRQYYRVVVE